MSLKEAFDPVADKLKAARERRHYGRLPWVTHVTVAIAGDGVREYCADDTATHDFSLADISFTWRERVEPGTVITICLESLPQRPELTATVRHCTHVGGTFYHVGAEFIDNYEIPRSYESQRLAAAAGRSLLSSQRAAQ